MNKDEAGMERFAKEILRAIEEKCSSCKKFLPADFAFCAHCGQANPNFSSILFEKRMGRSIQDHLLLGNCAEGKHSIDPDEKEENQAVGWLYCYDCGKKIF